MRFLANENFPGDAVTALGAAGHDIVWVRTAAPGSKDEDILAVSQKWFYGSLIQKVDDRFAEHLKKGPEEIRAFVI